MISSFSFMVIGKHDRLIKMNVLLYIK